MIPESKIERQERIIDKEGKPKQSSHHFGRLVGNPTGTFEEPYESHLRTVCLGTQKGSVCLLFLNLPSEIPRAIMVVDFQSTEGFLGDSFSSTAWTFQCGPMSEDLPVCTHEEIMEECLEPVHHDSGQNKREVKWTDMVQKRSKYIDI